MKVFFFKNVDFLIFVLFRQHYVLPLWLTNKFKMRAKEYLFVNESKLAYAKEIGNLLEKLSLLRLDKEATEVFYNQVLSSDVHIKNYNYQKKMHDSKNAMQQDTPVKENFEGELSIENSSGIRKEMLKVIQQDESYGYLYYLLGTEYNSSSYDMPIDCIPDVERIKAALATNRDDYPKSSLDDYLEDSFNYDQYDKMIARFDLDSKQILEAFNKIYQLFDELRCYKMKISGIQQVLNEYTFKDEVEKFVVFSVVQNMIIAFCSQDKSMLRCHREIERVVLPLRKKYNSSSSSKDTIASKVFLNGQRGKKLDIIRVFNALYELDFFKNESQNKISKKEVFETLGRFLNIDLSNFHNDLSRSLTDSTALEKHLKIFEDMENKMENIFNSK